MGAQETTIFIAFGWVAALIGVLIIYLIYVFNKQQKRYRQLQKDKLNAEIKAAEEERNNIATELHNEIGPYLSSVKMRLDVLQTNNRVDRQMGRPLRHLFRNQPKHNRQSKPESVLW